MVGVCGLNIDPYAADFIIGRVRRLYVAQEARGQGVGRSLVQAVVDSARGRFQLLRVRTENAEAGRLYEKMGFTQEVNVPECTHSLELK
ncbi:MAG: GNAT family N-acetyltransferase [Gemmatales bacterium]